MLEVAIMIEGQNGLTWERWQRIVREVEDLGFVGLFRSDHFTNAQPPDLESLELWISLTWLAANTTRLEFGPLVTPFSFRHPAWTARMALGVDDLSAGRLVLGLGGGWQAREHEIFGFDLLDVSQRFARFEEGMECVRRLLRSEGPVSFDGNYFHLQEAQLLPRPRRSGGPRILVGGNGFNRTLALTAEYADEWNANFLPPDQFARANDHLNELLRAKGRQVDSVKRSLMTGCVFGSSAAELQNKLVARGRTAEELRRRGILVGNGQEVRDQLQQLGAAGVERVMLQWLELDDLDGLRALAKAILH